MMNFFAIDPLNFVYVTIAVVVLMTVVSFLHEKKMKGLEKKVFFLIITIPIALTTLYMAAHTIHHNVVSDTGGPVHWHLDYQVWVCGERMDLVNPKGLSNKVGTPLFHEHNDDRIHLEGTVLDVSEVDLGDFFGVVGGFLDDTKLVYPTQDQGFVDVTTGDDCDGTPAELAVYINGHRIRDVANYLYYPHPLVPPGDCGIIVFEPNPGETTDKLCESWVAQEWDYNNYEQKRANYEDFNEDHAHYQGLAEEHH